MEIRSVDAFWSYVHQDDVKSKGRVLSLASALQDEFSLTTGDDLDIFVDRKDLKWGQVWRDRINSALGDAPFFIPVVTPSYFRSDECRRELIEFSGESKSRGFDRLLLPILFIPVVGLSESSDDEVVALISRTQYVDWTALRLLDPSDTRVLQAINALALRIQELKTEVSTTTLATEANVEIENAVSLSTAVAEISERLEPWLDSVEFDRVAGMHWRASRDERLARVQRLVDNGSAQSAIYSTLVRLGQDLLPIAKDRVDKARIYARLSIELDPFVTTAIRLAGSQRNRLVALNQLRDAVNEAIQNIEPEDTSQWGFFLPNSILTYNKHLAEANKLLEDSAAYVKDGNNIVVQWRDKLVELDGPKIIPVRESPHRE